MRSEVYRLTIKYWPQAVEAGVRPIEVLRFFGLDAPNPAYYTADHFIFKKPPSREDFLGVCKTLYWTYGWEQTLFPLIESNPWPILDFMHKAADSKLLDEQGRHIGTIEVDREYVYDAQSYDRAVTITCDVKDALTKDYRGDCRKAARDYLENNKHGLLEAYHREGLGIPLIDFIRPRLKKEMVK